MNRNLLNNDGLIRLIVFALEFFLFIFFIELHANNSNSFLKEARDKGRENSKYLNIRSKTISLSNDPPKSDIKTYDKKIKTILKNNCIGCHGPQKAKAKLRIDTLNPNLIEGKDIGHWLEIYDVVSNMEMPPEDDDNYHLSDKKRLELVNWLGYEIEKASLVKKDKKTDSSFRRMANYEYNYALQDLLGLKYQFINELPPETVSEHGFKNTSEHLYITPMQLETYLNTARNALQKAVIKGERPKPIVYEVLAHDYMPQQIKANQVRIKKRANLIKNKSLELQKLKENQGSKAQITKLEKNIKSQKKFIEKLQAYSPKTNQDKNIYKSAHFMNHSNEEVFKLSGIKGREPIPNAKIEVSPSINNVSFGLGKDHSLAITLNNGLPDKGPMLVSIRAGLKGGNPNSLRKEMARLRLSFGASPTNQSKFKNVVSEVDIPVTTSHKSPQWINFNIPLSEIQRNPYNSNYNGEKSYNSNEVIYIENISNATTINEQGLPLTVYIDYIKIIAPYYTEWPPKSHKNIFFTEQRNISEKAYVRKIIDQFLKRAWRRKLSSTELNELMSLYSHYRPSFDNVQDAILEVLATGLASPQFLYIHQNYQFKETKGKFDDLDLATRLAIFLWSSLPDQELLELAQKQELSNKKELERQVERMLRDKKSDRFTNNFVEQWLNLENMDSVQFDKKLQEKFLDELRDSSRQEPKAFFAHVLKNNKSIIDFIHSSYVVIDENLGQHYQIKTQHGMTFKDVPIASNFHRGGLLTTSSLLAMNSDGKNSHPLKRGIWILEHFLNDPPPPAPANVPEVDLTDPRILKMTVKERLADHRKNPACITCHAKIDPWGIAFENFNALGIYKEKNNGKSIDSFALLNNRTELNGVLGAKHYLLSEKQDQFARAMVYKLLTYALGRPLTFGDHQEIEHITLQLRRNQDRLRSLIHIITQSKLFQS